jgi:hypothetical protein
MATGTLEQSPKRTSSIQAPVVAEVMRMDSGLRHDVLQMEPDDVSIGSPDSSDPAILRRILRNTMKGTAALEVDEKPHEGIRHNDHRREEKIDAWIANVEKLREVESTGEVWVQVPHP